VPAGSVGVPIRLADPSTLGLVRPGNRVDLLRVGGSSPPVATSALVLEVGDTGDPTTGSLLLALTRAEAEQVVAAQGSLTQGGASAPGPGFAVLIRPD
jgi:hypothetical protein